MAWRSLGWGLAALLLAGCLDSRRALRRAPGSALWVGAGAQGPGADELNRLREAGVRELFVEAGEIHWSAGRFEFRSLLGARGSGRRVATLVLRGAWPEEALDSEAVAQDLLRALRRLRLEAEERGLLPVGFHFDLSVSGSGAHYGQVLAALRREQEEPLYLSATLPTVLLESPEAEALVRGVDFLVAFVYGQRPGERERPEAWDLARVEEAVQHLESLRKDYLVGVVTLGAATHLRQGREPVAVTTQVSLGTLVSQPGLRLSHGFTLQGLHRQTYSLEAERPLRLAGWEIRPRDQIQVVRLGAHHLVELRRRLQHLNLSHWLGEVYYRHPLPEEGLSLRPESLVHVLEGFLPAPDLRAEVALRTRSPRRWVLSLRLENRSAQGSDLALLGNNYLEVAAEGGVFGAVEPGEFHRFDLLRAAPGGEPIRTFRQANLLRLHRHVLGGYQTVESGDIEVLLSDPEQAILAVTARFLLPDGRTVEMPPTTWRP